MADSTSAPTTPGLPRRIGSMLYDALLLIAVVFIAGFAFSALTSFRGSGPLRHVFQLFIVCVIAGYFLIFWLKSGQTLAMKTWRIKLVSASEEPLDAKQCLVRIVVATAGIIGFGAGIWWAWCDRDGQFLHDRIAGTRLVMLK